MLNTGPECFPGKFGICPYPYTVSEFVLSFPAALAWCVCV